jgi:hypothetical protein
MLLLDGDASKKIIPKIASRWDPKKGAISNGDNDQEDEEDEDQVEDEEEAKEEEEHVRVINMIWFERVYYHRRRSILRVIKSPRKLNWKNRITTQR